VAHSALINITETITGFAASRRSPWSGEKRRHAAGGLNTMATILCCNKIDKITLNLSSG